MEQAFKLGARIQKYRQGRELTREELAERTGLAVDFLAAVEEDEVYPSLGPLLKIARSLGVRLGTFLDDQVNADPLIVRRQDRTPQLTTHRGKGSPQGLTFHSLGRGKTDRRMEPFYVEILPESGGEPELSSHEGEEFIVVLSGRVRLTYGGEVSELEPGDSMYYNSVVPHHVGAAGGERAEIYAVLYIPE
ncbi:MAG: cupin domain-containing protein [Deltaproteobacteria bacterium]|nr:cupin domain-containing protein [Deltaproteobacteria bacterium]